MSASIVDQSRKHRKRGTELPEEVLRRVFTAVCDGVGGEDDILSLMMVCRHFAVSVFTLLTSRAVLMVVQTLAEDVLLHSVVITSLAQLQDFEARLRKPTLPYRSPVISSGLIVRSLEIHQFDDDLLHTLTLSAEARAKLMDWNTSVTSVIALLPLLQHFALCKFYATRGHITCLRAATQGHLTSLDITLWFDYNLSSGVFQSINSL
jgi:hypothetical protein